MTRGNIEAPWILFEAGALSNSLRAKDLVCPLLIGLDKADIRPPLSQFQLTDADRTDVRRLLDAINLSFNPDFRLAESTLDRQFNMWWPELEPVLAKAADLSRSGAPDVPLRTQEDILQEVLQSVRRLERDVPSKQVEEWNALEELLDEHTDPQILFKSGEAVHHPTFGKGTIRELSGLGRDLKAVIDFPNLGRKKILIRYANLKRVTEDHTSTNSDGA